MDWSITMRKRDVAAIDSCAWIVGRFYGTPPASDTDALQLPHGFANVRQCYVIRDVRRADARRDNEADFSAFEFLVAL